jgi:hypothetical protein
MAKKTKTIHVKVRTLDEVGAFVTEQIPRYYRGVFVEQVARFLVGILTISEPPYKLVSRFRAYGMQDGGPGWFSEKQRRYVMMMIKKGVITPGTSQRTGATAEGWHTEQKGTKTVIVNTTEGARWTMNDYWQARQPALVGWQKTGDVIRNNIDDALLYAIDQLGDKI